MTENYKSNKSGFIKGLVTGVAVIVILGGVFFAGKNFGGDSGSSVVRTGSPSPSAPTAQPPSGPPTPTSIQLAAVTDDDWIKGKKDAPITVVEFSDLECPFCKRFHPTMQQLLAEYPDDVRWVYRHFPLTSLHPKAPKEAEATECAGEQGGDEAFWAYTDRLFEITPSNNGLAESQLPQIAEDVGLNGATFQDCLDSGKYAQKVQDQYQLAIAAGGTGTPYSVVVTPDGEEIPVQGAVPYAQLKSIIDASL